MVSTNKTLRIGRTGRKGHKGKSISFIERGRDEQHAPNLVKMLNDAHQPVPDWLNAMAGNKSHDFDRGQDDLRNNPAHRAPNAPYQPGKFYQPLRVNAFNQFTPPPVYKRLHMDGYKRLLNQLKIVNFLIP